MPQQQFQEDFGGDITKDQHKNVIGRMDLLPEAYWQQNPVDAASLVNSSVPASHIYTVGQNWDTTAGWVREKTTFGGTSGALASAYLKSLNISDPQTRAESLQTIESIRALPLEQQKTFALWLQNPQAFATTNPEELQAALEGVMGEGNVSVDQGSIRSATGQGTTPTEISLGEDVSTDTLASLYSLFPQLQGQVKFEGAGITLNDIKESYVDNAADQFGGLYLSNNPAAYARGLLQGTIHVASQGIAAGFGLLAYVPGTALGWGIDKGVKLLPEDRESYFRKQSIIAGRKVDLINEIVRQDTRFIGSIQARALGYKPGTSEYDQAAEDWGNVDLAVLLHSATEAAGAAKIASTETPEAAAARLGLVTEEGTTHAQPLASVSENVRALGTDTEGNFSAVRAVTKVIEHPVRSLLDPITKAIAFNISKLPPEKMVTGGMAREMIQTMLDLKIENPETAIANFEMRYASSGVDVTRIAHVVYDSGTMHEAQVNLLDAYQPKVRQARLDAIDSRLSDIEVQTDHPLEGQTISLPADKLVDVLDFPERAKSFTGRTPEQIATLRESLRTGYDVNTPNALAESGTIGPIEMLVDPEGRAVIREGHHRIGILAEEGQQVPVKIKYVDHLDENVGANIDEVQGTLTPAQEELSLLNTGRSVEASQSLGDILAQYEDPISRLELQGETLALKDERASMELDTPLESYKYPDTSDLRQLGHRVLYNPRTPFERLYSHIINPGRYVKEFANRFLDSKFEADQTPWIAKLFDKIDNRPMLDLTDSAFAADSNRTAIMRVGRKIGFSNKELARVITDFENASTPHENFLAWQKWDILLDQHLPTNTPLQWRERIHNSWRRSKTDFTIRVPDGRGGFEPLILEKGGSHRPAVPIEFLGDKIPLVSDVNLLDNALSTTKRLVENAFNERLSMDVVKKRATLLSEKGGISLDEATSRILATQGSSLPVRLGALAYKAVNTIMSASRLTQKPAFLLVKMPGIILKKEIDEAIGNTASPNMQGSFRPSIEEVTDLLRGPDNERGALNHLVPNLFEDSLDHSSTMRVIEDVPIHKLVETGEIDKRGPWVSQARRIQFMNSDPMVRAFVQSELDVAAMAERITGGDAYLTQAFNEGPKYSLDAVGMDIQTYLTRLRDGIEHGTFGADPEVMSLVSRGHADNLGNATFEQVQNYLTYAAENDAIKARVQELGNGNPEIRALQEQLVYNMERMEQIDALAGDSGVTMNRVKARDESAVARRLQDRFNDGSLNVGDHMAIDRWVNDDLGTPGSLGEIASETSRAFSSWAYRRLRTIGEWEAKFSKGSFFEQRAWQWRKSLMAEGMPEAQAQAVAIKQAVNETRDLFYELSTRSSAERAARNIFWFAPVQGELMFRWFYGIPAQTGNAALGLALNGAKALNYFNLFKNLGIIRHDDATDEWVLPIDGAGQFAQALSQHLPGSLKIRVPDKLGIPLESISHIHFGAPSLSSPAAAVLNVVAQHAPAIRAMADYLDPYGGAPELFPGAVRSAFAMLGINLPDFSPGYEKQQWDRTHDVAIQYAVTDLAKRGDPRPEIDAYKTDAEYQAAYGSWFSRMMTEANEYAKGIYGFKVLQGTIIPGSVIQSSEERDQYLTFFKNKVLPAYEGGRPTPEQSALVRNTTREWLLDHPESLAFSVSYNYYTGKDYHAPVDETSEKYYRDLYLNGVKDVMSPNDYAEVLPALMAKAHYDYVTSQAIEDVAPSTLGAGQAPELLRNWGDRRTILQDNYDQWSRYRTLHPRAASLIDSYNVNKALYFDGVPTEDDQLGVISDALKAAGSLSSLFTGESTMTSDEYNGYIGTLRQAQAELLKDTSKTSVSQLDKDLSWYFGKVDEYSGRTQDLYNEAARLRDAGQDASSIYDQIKNIRNEYDGLSHRGESYPGMDEFFFSSKSPTQQRFALIAWTTRPQAWLSDWQREQVGYDTFSGEDEMWARISESQNQYQPLLIGLSTQSATYDGIRQLMDASAQGIAAQYGAEGTAAYQLDQQAPIARLQATDFGAGNATWARIAGAVTVATQAIQASGDNPRYYGQTSKQWKLWIYAQIQGAEQADPEFAKLMTDLSFAIPAAGSPGEQRTGVPLYEAIFFGQFTYQFIPPDMIAAYQGQGV